MAGEWPESDFDTDEPARSCWQHDARLHSGDRLALFDNASSPPQRPYSRGLVSGESVLDSRFPEPDRSYRAHVHLDRPPRGETRFGRRP